MTAAALPRMFRYNSVELEDPGPEHDPVEVRNLYAATYPEITSAAIDGPEVKDGKRVYTFRKAVGTKGADADQARGLYNKFAVQRREDPGGKHFGCEYFVLDLNHDKFAYAALVAYANACGMAFPVLARDLRAKAEAIRVAHGL